MKVAIIGAGNVGKALAASAKKAGHQVTISSKHAGNAQEAAKTTNTHAAGSNREAVEGADLVILAVPTDKVDEVVGALTPDLEGKVVVDVSNRVDVQDPGRTLDGTSIAERLQKQVPKAHVVKAFNYAFAARLADPKVNGYRLDAFVAGDDEAAKKEVLEFADSIGFRPIDAGPLAMARALEGMAALNITLQIRNNWPWQNGWKLAGPPEE